MASKKALLVATSTGSTAARPLLPLALTILLFPILIQSYSNHPPSRFDFIKNLQGYGKGATVEGLNQLRKYLENFGYLPITSTTTAMATTTNSHNGHDDLFDDSLELAVKRYQQFFHLNVSGKLDAATVEQMVKPRCGRPDVINNLVHQINDSTAAVDYNNTDPQHFHAVQHYSYFPGRPKWPKDKRHLTYGFLNGEWPVSRETLRWIMASSFSRWQKVGWFTFQMTTNAPFANLKIGFFRGDHRDGHPFDGTGGELAHAFPPPIGLLHLDADELWSTLPVANRYDLESVAMHEIGHLLGLDHFALRSAVMYPNLSPGERRVILSPDDSIGLTNLYMF